MCNAHYKTPPPPPHTHTHSPTPWPDIVQYQCSKPIYSFLAKAEKAYIPRVPQPDATTFPSLPSLGPFLATFIRLFLHRLINAAVMVKIHTVEWTPAILNNTALRAGVYLNWGLSPGDEVSTCLILQTSMKCFFC